MSTACKICHAPDADGGFCDMCDLNDPGGVEIFHKGEQAGRLAAIRADVLDYAGWCDRSAAQHDIDAEDLRERARELPSYEAISLLAGMFGYGHHRGEAVRYRRHAGDCRRWLGATR